MKLLSSLATVAMLGGCGGAATNNSAPGVVNGTVHGNALHIVDAVSTTVLFPADSSPNRMAAIVLSTSEHLCADLRANVQHPSTAYVSMLLFDRVGDTTMTTSPTTPGEYPMFAGIGTTQPRVGAITVLDVDAQCANLGTSRASGTSGSVDLQLINGDVFDGAFDVTLTTGEHVSGEFVPTSCPGIDAFATNQGGPACNQPVR